MSECGLWQEVLRAAVDDAILGPAAVDDPKNKRRICKEAREYLTTPSKDLSTVCALAGLDPDAVTDRMRRRIAGAPSIDEIAGTRRKSRATLAKRKTGRKGKSQAATYTFNGETLTANEWSEKTGIHASTISRRIASGWPVSDALTFSTGEGKRRAIRAANVRNQPRRTRSDVRTYTYNGEAMTLKQWGERLTINPYTLQSRLRAGWSMAETFGTSREEGLARIGEAASVRERGRLPRLFTHEGQTLTIRQWAEQTGIKHQTIDKRLRSGWSVADALTPGDNRGGQVRLT